MYSQKKWELIYSEKEREKEMGNQVLKRFSVIDGTLKETNNNISPSFSYSELFHKLNIKVSTLKIWIQKEKRLPAWALQKLSILPNNSGYIRSPDNEQYSCTYIESLANGYDSINLMIRRDGTPRDIPIHLVPGFSRSKDRLSKHPAQIKNFSRSSSETFLSTLTAVGREDKEETRP